MKPKWYHTAFVMTAQLGMNAAHLRCQELLQYAGRGVNMNILNRLDMIERRLNDIEAMDTSYKYSRRKDNTINVNDELDQIRALIGVNESNESKKELNTLVVSK